MKLRYFLLALLVTIPNIVHASEYYFNNDNGVQLTKEEYDYIVERFDTKFPEIMSLDDYNKLINEDLMKNKINTVISEEILPLSAFYETASKSLKLSSVCTSSYCGITVVVHWKNNPNTRSYDVLGAYLEGNSLRTTPTTYLTSSANTIYSSEIVNQANGFGVSIKLPTNANGITLYQYYDTTPGGTIYQSYQHAKSSTTLANSKKYTISRSGYGGVFLFNNTVKDKYDAMGGVNLAL